MRLWYGIDTPGAIIATIILALSYAILIRALLSWVNPDPRNPVVQALDAITEPILQPLRQVVPRIGMIDITPMVAIFVLYIIQRVMAGGL